MRRSLHLRISGGKSDASSSLTQHTWDPQLHAPHTSCPTCLNTFIGDYFGITSAGGKSYTTSVTTYADGTNSKHYQQQVIAILAIP